MRHAPDLKGIAVTAGTEPRLTSLAHGGGCGCKIAPNVLREILGGLDAPLAPPALLVDAATSDDAAVYKISDDAALVATTDFFMPVVDDPFDFGRIAATNALSDVYAMGARPIFALAIVGMPIDKLSKETIRRILEGGNSVASAAGAPIAGGHSIDSVEPIYGLVAMGLVAPSKLLKNTGARPGDVLILGKPLGIGVFSAALKKGLLSAADYDVMISSTTLLNTPGAELATIAGVHAVTDVTGFGLLGHLAEMCRGGGVGAHLREASIPVYDGARRLAADGIRTGASARNWASVADIVDAAESLPAVSRDILCDPQTSGGLLVAAAPECAEEVIALFRQHGHASAAVIGEITAGDARISVR